MVSEKFDRRAYQRDLMRRRRAEAAAAREGKGASEMVERVARAMFPSVFREDSGLEVTRAERRRGALNKARLAIEAMREPTSGMMDLIEAAEWRAAIDVALGTRKA